jgi:hypothetical protein
MNIDKEKVGTWYYSEKGKKIILYSILFALVITLLLIVILEYVLHLNQLDIPLFISTGVIPFLMYLVPAGAFIMVLKSKLKADKIELMISIATIVFTSYIVMTFVGIWLRGEAMHLIF